MEGGTLRRPLLRARGRLAPPFSGKRQRFNESRLAARFLIQHSNRTLVNGFRVLVRVPYSSQACSSQFAQRAHHVKHDACLACLIEMQAGTHHDVQRLQGGFSAPDMFRLWRFYPSVLFRNNQSIWKWGTREFLSRVPALILQLRYGVGRGTGVGRGLGEGAGRAVGVGLIVELGVTDADAVAVAVAVAVGVPDAVVVAVAVGVGLGVNPLHNPVTVRV